MRTNTLKQSTILLLDCTPLRIAGPWFRDALRKCGVFDLLIATPEDDLSIMNGADSLIISGSPLDAFAEDELTHLAMNFSAEGIARGLPVLGVCYGHQLLGRLHGARVSRNPLGWEVGDTLINSTAEISPLGLTHGMLVLESHQDYVTDPPSSCRVLASNDHTPVQAAQWGPLVYGVQFHPEFNGNILRNLWEDRRDQWRGITPFDLDAKLDNAGDCEKGLAVLRQFLEIKT